MDSEGWTPVEAVGANEATLREQLVANMQQAFAVTKPPYLGMTHTLQTTTMDQVIEGVWRTAWEQAIEVVSGRREAL
jgi:hypothetical protein